MAEGNYEYAAANDRNRQPSEYPKPEPVTSRDAPGEGAVRKAAKEVEKRKSANDDAAEIARKALLGY